MVRWFKKSLIVILSTGLITTGISVTAADYSFDDHLPDMGTTAGDTLSINQELTMGDYYVRQLRGSAPIIDDPLLSGYINRLGMRLVSQANSVRTPFHFYLIRNDEINAFAFFGGNVVLHSAIFRYTDTESELASVLAHEISHVTQRHLARMMQQQQQNAPLTWVGALGSVLLSMANPQVGMAALSGTLAGTRQGMISFTQQNEQEADRIGLQVLQRAGFDPQGMPNFMQILSDKTRYDSKLPEMLLTHPLPESRLADARNRANQMPPHPVASSADFLFAKVRTLGMYSGQRNGNTQLDSTFLHALEQGNQRQQQAATYARAIIYNQQNKFDDARRTLQPLLASQPDNDWFIDLMTDIDISQQRAPDAIRRLENALAKKSGDAVLQINLANAYIEGNQPQQASRLLYRYTYKYPNDTNGWDLLSKASAAQGLRDEELAARAESIALAGQLDDAISMLKQASSISSGDKRARYNARADQLRQLQLKFKPYQK